MASASAIHTKVVLLGDSGVGKTSITMRFVSDTFQHEVDSTMGATYLSRVIQYSDKTFKFNIWDTAGQERYRAIAKMYYQDAQVAILVYDITKRESFESLKSWLKELREHGPPNLGTVHVVLAVAGNKEDLIDEEEVDIDEVRAWTSNVGAVFKKTSAKTSAGVQALFREIAGKLDSSLESAARPRVGGLSLERDPPKPRSEGCKC